MATFLVHPAWTMIWRRKPAIFIVYVVLETKSDKGECSITVIRVGTDCVHA